MAVATLPGALVVEPHTRFARLRSKFGRAQNQKTSEESDIERSKHTPRNELEEIEPLSYWQLYSWVLLQVHAVCPLHTQLLEAAHSLLIFAYQGLGWPAIQSAGNIETLLDNACAVQVRKLDGHGPHVLRCSGRYCRWSGIAVTHVSAQSPLFTHPRCELF